MMLSNATSKGKRQKNRLGGREPLKQNGPHCCLQAKSPETTETKKKQGKNPASFALAQNKVRTIVPTFFEIN
jgi:hypothetical protein